ncbi:hypothetical protein QQS21_002591 [Conoideocrella luteorostrata]|uniref:Metallo-beta-lactamase domain-containing protein n=1 Tax=Conoideocrella luteorostrata TaxID=1105319 RepID=A0AAJ0CXZ2_9HYPO|nr:hypothetical protein QQS21_002591 [Conoideocrella luteorostrata]
MDLIICNACGVQYDSRSMRSCKICDDPRQFVPPEGQTWTSLREMQLSKRFTNEFRMDAYHTGVISILTQPQVAIGQRAILLCSPKGNVLWDCISYIDDDTIRRINDLGGIKAIVVSHPHYFSTTCEWGKAFDCPVYLSAEDEGWLGRKTEHIKLWKEQSIDLLDGEFQAVKAGGHFPGSSVLLWKPEKKLFVGDTVTVVPSGNHPDNRLPGKISFTFMWSYPNMIPLSPDEVLKVWKAIAPLDFEDAYTAFWTRDCRGLGRKRLLESAQIFVSMMGFPDHAIHKETL